MQIEIITHYSKDDPQCNGDYRSVDVKIDGKMIESYGDSYHEKGDIRAESFVEGVKWALETINEYDGIEVTQLDVADSNE